MDTLFTFSNLLVMPFWLLMIVAPRWSWTERLMKSLWVVVPPAVLYGLLVLPQWPAVFGDLANPALTAMMALLGSPAGATIGWIHFLAFDLFVGRWAYLDSRERNYHPLLMAPLLFAVLMVGPLGLLLYLAVRWVARPGNRP